MAERRCSVPGCIGSRYQAAGLCTAHYIRRRRYGRLDRVRKIGPADGRCSLEGCGRPHDSHGLCSMHQHRMVRQGHTGPLARVGQRPRGGYVNNNGYRMVSRNGRQIPEHRAVMERVLGRSLSHDESVHHRNGDRLDNRPENLELWSSRQPSGQRVAEKVAWARELIALYDPDPEWIGACG